MPGPVSNWAGCDGQHGRACVLNTGEVQAARRECVADHSTVEQAIAGRRPRLVPAEEAVAVAVLAARGWSDDRIARWLGIRFARVSDLRPASVGRAVSLPAGCRLARLRAS